MFALMFFLSTRILTHVALYVTLLIVLLNCEGALYVYVHTQRALQTAWHKSYHAGHALWNRTRDPIAYSQWGNDHAIYLYAHLPGTWSTARRNYRCPIFCETSLREGGRAEPIKKENHAILGGCAWVFFLRDYRGHYVISI